jgi:hypothetical protein
MITQRRKPWALAHHKRINERPAGALSLGRKEGNRS